MKKTKKIFAFLFLILNIVSCKIFAASAYLEGDEALEKKPSFIDGLDSAIIMANWYKIVLIVVAILCVSGLVTGNIIWFIKKRRNNK